MSEAKDPITEFLKPLDKMDFKDLPIERKPLTPAQIAERTGAVLRALFRPLPEPEKAINDFDFSVLNLALDRPPSELDTDTIRVLSAQEIPMPDVTADNLGFARGTTYAQAVPKLLLLEGEPQ
jgi:hypothetical protein